MQQGGTDFFVDVAFAALAVQLEGGDVRVRLEEGSQGLSQGLRRTKERFVRGFDKRGKLW